MSFRNEFGVAFAEDGKDMADGKWHFDSRKPKWTVDIKATPPHLKVFPMDGGTKWTIGPTPAYMEEVLFSVEHHMLFPPEFLCFFYITDAPAGHAVEIGHYTSNQSFMNYNNITLGAEGLFAFVDDKYFYIKHYAETYINPTTSTFDGSDFKFRVRYELLNQPAIYLGSKF